MLGSDKKADKAAIAKALPVTKAVQTGGYQKDVTQVQPCVWPNHCAKEKAHPEYLVADKPVTTCVWPNTCSVN